MTDLLLALAARAPDTLIGWRAGAAVRQDAFLLRVRAWSALARRTPGANLALYLEDSIEFAAALLGAWQAGKTVWLSADALPASCATLAASVDAFLGQFPAAFSPAVPAGGDCCPLDWRAIATDFAAMVVYTSGSTGAAEAIPKCMSQLSTEVATLEARFGLRLGDAEIVATVSHQHIYGLLFAVLWPLAAGRALDAHRQHYPETLVRALGRRPCVLVASPAHLKRLPGHLDWAASALQLRAVFSSGGMLGEDAARAARTALGQVPIEVYGSSETGGIAWRQRLAGSGEGWQALPGVAWRVNAGGDHLEVRSPHAGSERWVRLADRIEALDATRFLLLGRSDRIVKIEEKRVSLDAIETALVASGLAREARVIPVPDTSRRRQALAAFVVPSAAGQALLEGGGKPALNRRLRAQLAPAVERVAIPRRWRYLEQMPADAQGKTTHSQLAALLGQERDRRPRLPTVRLLESAASRVLLGLDVPASLIYFDGHFPIAPVLPGVVQLDWAIIYGRAYFELGPAFRAIQALKFQQMIRAERPVQLELVHDTANGSLHFRYLSEAGPHASGRVFFGTA